jgi:hypothetical protein
MTILYEAKLDRELKSQIKQECPDLLKEPQKINPDEKKLHTERLVTFSGIYGNDIHLKLSNGLP